MTPRQKDILEPFADMYAKMDERLSALGAEELIELRKACNSVSTTNCWHATYAAAHIIAPLIDAWLAVDRQRRKERSPSSTERE